MTSKRTGRNGEAGGGTPGTVPTKPPGESPAGDAGEPQTYHGDTYLSAPFGLTPEGKPRKRRLRGFVNDLPRALESLTVDAFRSLQQVLRMDVHGASDARLRAIVTADLGVLQGKIRVDEGSLRVKQHNDVLERLDKLLAEARKIVPAKG
jgi:hypothetical protein